ncbi:quinon protein alcohol dehydrogenase-like superfamily [Lactarius quietus]|nr:quinon protein alcohol dehydrogenase-like superfamily [Lactarius quietus]
MALLGTLHEAVTHLNRIRTWIISLKGRANKASDWLVDWMDNSLRLLPNHATIISYNSLLIYDSALFTSAAKIQPQVIEMKRSHPYPLHNAPHELCAHSEFISALIPTFKFCLDFTPVVSWSPNSQRVAVCRVNGIEIRDALSRSIVDSFDLYLPLDHVLDPKKASCRCLVYYPDSSRVAYVVGDRVHVRNTLARTEEFMVTGHEGGLVGISVSPNGMFLVSGSKSGCIQGWNAETGDLLWAVETGPELKSMSISPNSRFIVSASCNRGIQIWNANDGLSLNILPHDVTSVSFSSDSTHLINVDQEGRVCQWGISQMTTEPIQERSIGAQPSCLRFSPNDRQIAAATGDQVYILRRDTDDVVKLDGHTGPVTSLSFSADGLTLASGSLDGTIRVWDASFIGRSRADNGGLEVEVWKIVHWSPRGQIVMESEAKFFDSKARIRNTRDGTFSVMECQDDSEPVAISDCGRFSLRSYSS